MQEKVKHYKVLKTKFVEEQLEKRTSESWNQQFDYSSKEDILFDHEKSDPIGDTLFNPIFDLLELIHRYPDRVLLLATKKCPVFCRFCFRKEVVGSEGVLDSEKWNKILLYLENHHEVREVIFSGGDPLYINPHKLKIFLSDLNSLTHIKTIRFHSRVLTVAPHLINDHLIDALSVSNKSLYLMAHINHPDEFTKEAIAALRKILSIVNVLGQSVLLKGVNDDFETLKKLFLSMIENRIIPAYLHQMDYAKGTHHFGVSIERGRSLIKQLQGQIPGYAIPRYILDLPDGGGKIPIGPSFEISCCDKKNYVFSSVNNKIVNYTDHFIIS